MGTATQAGAEALKMAIAAWWRQLRSYLQRLPLLTRVIMVAIPAVHMLVSFGVPLEESWALDPSKMDFKQMHRLNTYPLIHTGFMHALLNLVALIPLLERFEKELGTLKTTVLIAGPIVTFPAGLYLLVEMGLLRGSQAVVGASALVFTLLAIEAVKTCGFQPTYTIVGREIPTWMTPILWMVLASFLVPGSSALGHFCGLVMGYMYACRYIPLMEPNEWILKKAEEKLGFLLLRLPWYISIGKRMELNYMEMLPVVGGGAARSAEAGSAGRFNTPGRPLGPA